MAFQMPKENDICQMIKAQCHVGSRNLDFKMRDYIWRRRQVRCLHVFCGLRCDASKKEAKG